MSDRMSNQDLPLATEELASLQVPKFICTIENYRKTINKLSSKYEKAEQFKIFYQIVAQTVLSLWNTTRNELEIWDARLSSKTVTHSHKTDLSEIVDLLKSQEPETLQSELSAKVTEKIAWHSTLKSLFENEMTLVKQQGTVNDDEKTSLWLQLQTSLSESELERDRYKNETTLLREKLASTQEECDNYFVEVDRLTKQKCVTMSDEPKDKTPDILPQDNSLEIEVRNREIKCLQQEKKKLLLDILENERVNPLSRILSSKMYIALSQQNSSLSGQNKKQASDLDGLRERLKEDQLNHMSNVHKLQESHKEETKMMKELLEIREKEIEVLTWDNLKAKEKINTMKTNECVTHNELKLTKDALKSKENSYTILQGRHIVSKEINTKLLENSKKGAQDYKHDTAAQQLQAKLTTLEEAFKSVSEEVNDVSQAYEEEICTANTLRQQLEKKDKEIATFLTLKQELQTEKSRLAKYQALYEEKLKNLRSQNENSEIVSKVYGDSFKARQANMERSLDIGAGAKAAREEYKRETSLLVAESRHLSANLEEMRKIIAEKMENELTFESKYARIQGELERTKEKLKSREDFKFDKKRSRTTDDSLAEENDELRRRLTCTVCTENFRDHILTKCCHIFCKFCLDKNIQTRNRKCSLCNSHFDQKDVKKIFLE